MCITDVISDSDDIYRRCALSSIKSFKFFLLAETKSFYFLLGKQNIFSLGSESKYRYIFTCRNKAKDFLSFEKITENFVLVGKTTTDKFLISETKPKIFLLAKMKIHILLQYVLNEPPYHSVGCMNMEMKHYNLAVVDRVK